MVPSPPSNRRRKGAGAMSYNSAGPSSNRSTASPNRPVQSSNNSRSRSLSSAVGEGASGGTSNNPFISGAVNARQHLSNTEEYGFSSSSDAVLESANLRRESGEKTRER